MHAASPDTPSARPKPTRSEQSRLNGAKSRGPTTPEGKAASSRNASRHGFSNPQALVIDGEDAAAFNRVHADLLTAWAPDCPDGCLLVQQLAVAYLQRDRANRWQVALFARDDEGMLKNPRQFELMMRYAHGLDRQIRRLREQLRALHERPLGGCLMVGDPALAERIPMPGEEVPEPSVTGAHAAPEPTAQKLRNEPEIPPKPPAKPLPSNDNPVPGLSPEQLALLHVELDLAERDGRTDDVTRLLCGYLSLTRASQTRVQGPPAPGGAPGQRPGTSSTSEAQPPMQVLAVAGVQTSRPV